jgi:polygalacturonase
MRIIVRRLALLLCTTLPFITGPLLSQDRRQVSEPAFPSITCATLEARLPAASIDETKLDTERIQDAIDRCTTGAVELKRNGAKNAFLTAPIHLKAGVTLVIDEGTALIGSRNPRDYDLEPGSCGVVNEKGHGCRPLITADHAPGAAIMGDGSIDGRGGAKLIVNQREQNVTWWDLAHQAKVEDLQQSCPRLIVIRESDGFVLYRITLRNSPNFHVVVDRTKGFTAWGVKIRTPKTARNTDGIDPSSSTNVTIAHCSIATGDDNVAIKAGNNGPATHMTIEHNHFYSGHGMSIGSETNGGASAIRVRDLTIDGADNGIRIKSDRSRGGLVEDVVYENVCIRNVRNPILLTTTYTLHGGDKLPIYRNILLKDVRSVTPGKTTMVGLDDSHPIFVEFQNVDVPGEKKIEHTGSIGSGFAYTLTCDFPPLDPSSAPEAPGVAPAEDHTLYVAADGTGEYSSVQQAIDAAPETGATISIAPGTYREVVTVKKPGIFLRGGGRDPAKIVIVFNKSAGDSDGTFNSATVNIRADDFRAENLTFANDFNATHPQLLQGSQALAVSVTGDRAIFRNVRLLGNQDTLYAGSKDCSPGGGEPCSVTRQYFSDCYIEGNVDFIFGDGKAYFSNCEIHSTPHNRGFITAQGRHYGSQDSAFVFDHCKLTAADGLNGVWLGRPWRPFAKVIFIDTEMGAHIAPGGWREWHPGDTNYLETVYYAERGSMGLGADRQKRDSHTKFLSESEARAFELKQFFGDWNPLR